MGLREYAGAAKRTTLVGDITAASTTLTVTDATGWPTGATGPFAIALNMGLAGEEKVLIASRSGNTLTVDTGGRGYDGTTAASHLSGSTADHVLTAIDIREANTHINATSAAHAATAISFAPAGGVAATTVQAAIEEVVSDASTAYVAKGDVQQAAVLTSETTTSTTYADLATAGPAVTATIGASGKALVIPSAILSNAGGLALMSFAVSGATTVAATDDTTARSGAVSVASAMPVLVTGLTPGSNTFTAKYRANTATASFERRRLTVIPL